MKKREKREKIEAIIFDVGGVLQLNRFGEKENSKGVHETIIRKAKVSVDYYFDSIDNVYPLSIEGKISEKEAVSIMSRNLNLSREKLKQEFEKAYKKFFILNKELFNFAKELKKTKLKIGILSDMWHLSKNALIIKEFHQNFNPLILSCDVGTRKPKKEIYELTIKKLKIKPERILFIDNRKWNLIPAKKLGMKTILFKNNKKTIKKIKNFLR